MKSYQAYKDSGYTWLGKVPEHWVFNKAKFIFNKMERPVREEDGVITAFRDGMVTLRTNRRTDGFTLSIKEIGYQGIRKGDLVIHEMDGFAGAIGVSDSDGKSTPVYTVCTPRKEASTKYYAYLLKMMAHNGFIQSLAKGIRERSTSFSFNIFQDLGLPYFPLAEQQAIVDFLDRKTSQIDTVIEKKQQQIELLDEQRMALINHAVTKGLNSDVPMKDSGITWLGEIPSHWRVVTLKYLVATKITDGPHETPEFVDDGVPFVSAEAVQKGRINFDSRRGNITREQHEIYAKKCLAQRDDIFLVKAGATTGKLAYVDTDIEFSVWSPLAQIRSNKELVNPRFLFMSLMSSYFQTQVQTFWSYGTQPNIGMKVLENLKVIVPPLNEQNSFLDILELELHQIDSWVEMARKQIKLFQEYRTALISEAVTGKIDVRTAV